MAWLGPDDSPITYLALGIGASFSSARVWDATEARYLNYDPANSESVDSFPLANRGDATWITVDDPVNWLQPTVYGQLSSILAANRASASSAASMRRSTQRLSFSPRSTAFRRNLSDSRSTSRRTSPQPAVRLRLRGTVVT